MKHSWNDGLIDVMACEMEDPLAAYYSFLIMGCLVIVAVVAIVWAVFPFLVLGALKRQQKTLNEIERNTRHL